MNWFRRFMQGRYGTDQLNLALIILSIALSFVSIFVKISGLSFIAFIPLVIAIYRVFSRQINKRQNENYKFMQGLYKIRNFFTNIHKRWKDRKKYKYYTCKNCKQKLRVPRGKGTLKVTCPKCSHSFNVKS